VQMISQAIEAKFDGQERNNSIYKLKFRNGGSVNTRQIAGLKTS